MIKMSNISKSYKNNVQALVDVDLCIPKGDFVFLTGASGAGKSTLIKLLLKEVNPDKGTLILNGQDITHISRRKIPEIRRNIGVVFQDFRLLENRTAYENIAYVMNVLGASSAEKKQRIPEVLELVGLASRGKAYPNQLSGGEQQRISIARAMVNKPDFFIADEPTGNLDPDTSWDIACALDKINQNGTTVLMSTHDKSIVDTMRKRVVKLEMGRLVHDAVGGYV